MVDFVKLATTAERLLAANGRSVTFIRHNQSLADTGKPWQGPTSARSAPAGISAQTAVFVQPSSASKLGIASEQSDLVMNSDQIMIVAPGTVDLTAFQEVLDAGVYWKIIKIEVLRPGATTVLAFVGVAR